MPSFLKSSVDTSTMRASSITCFAGLSRSETISSISEMMRGLVTTISRLPPRSTSMLLVRPLSASLTSVASANLRLTM